MLETSGKLLSKNSFKNLPHIPQLPLNRKRLLNLLCRHSRRNLRVIHHQFAEVFSEAPTLSVLCEGRGPYPHRLSLKHG
jgi:hypothetical protein